MNSSGTFDAETQYGDWEGKVQADNADFSNHIKRMFEDDGFLGADDFVVGVRFWTGENSAEELTAPTVSLFTVKAANHAEAKAFIEGSDPIPLRETRREMSFEQFFQKFKRFAIVAQWQGLDLLGHHITIEQP